MCLNTFIKRRKIFTVFLLLTNCCIGFSQHSSFHLDSVLNFKEIPITFNTAVRVVSIKSENDKLFMAFIKGNRFYLYSYDHTKKELVKTNFKLKNKHSIGTTPHDFVVAENYVYILLDKNVHCLSKAKMKEVNSFYCGGAEYLFLSQQNLIAGFYYNYHPADNPFKAGLRKFDLQGNQTDSIFLDVPFPEYTHYLPRNLITFNGEKYVFPLFDGLNFLFIDRNFKNVDTVNLLIEKFDSNWVFPSTSLSQSIANNRKDLSLYWELLDRANLKKISRIEYVKFIDSNTLFVRWYSYDSIIGFSKRYSMILVKNSTSWFPVEANSYLETPLPFNTSLSVYSGGMPLLSQSNLTTYTKHFIYQIKIDIPYIENLSYKEYYKKKKEKEKTLEPVISIWVFKYYD